MKSLVNLVEAERSNLCTLFDYLKPEANQKRSFVENSCELHCKHRVPLFEQISMDVGEEARKELQKRFDSELEKN